MAREKIDLREELKNYKYEFDLLQEIPCSKEENKKYSKILRDGGNLPKNVYPYEYEIGTTSTREFYTIYETDLTDAEIQEYLMYKKLSLIKSIKNYILFFVILTIMSIIGYIFILFWF